MSTALLESALAQMFPPNLTIRRRGWIWRNGEPTEIEYVLGSDEVGHQYIREVGRPWPLEMTPMDSKEDLQESV